jgi:DNA-binding response OmpR family regulator
VLKEIQQNETVVVDIGSDERTHYDCLLVDDEEASSLATCEYFGMFQVSVFWAQDAEACMDFFKKHTTDLILLDINLADTSGFDLCKRLRKITNVPIIFISARHSDDDKLLALSIGGDDFLQKPYSFSVLLAKVKVILMRYRQSNENHYDKTTLNLGRFILIEDEHRTSPDRPWAHPASCTMNTGSIPGVKRPGRGVDRPSPSSVPRS